MNQTTTSIQYEAVKNASDEIKNRSASMDDLFNKFRNIMAEIYQKDAFEGTASDAFQEKFDTLKTKFDAYVQTVEEFSAIIERARSETQDTENAIRREAENLAE